jgi:hypothetical protein
MKSRPLLNSLALCWALITSLWPLTPALVPMSGETVAPAAAYQIFLPALMNGAAQPAASGLPSLHEFAAAVADGEAGVVRGVYAPSMLAFRVRQQPADNPGYVSAEPGVVTQFQSAAALGVTGLLAHNHLAGADFFRLGEGMEVSLIYGDGTLALYRVTAIYRYQALQPTSPYSDFVDLSTGETLSVGQVFTQMYAGSDHVTFQTCIERNGDPVWGRLFVIAMPVK